MRKFVILFFCALFLSCSKVETALSENIRTNLDKTVVVSPSIEVIPILKSVTPKIKLNSKQTKYLNESLPPKVRKILDGAEKFEMSAEGRAIRSEG